MREITPQHAVPRLLSRSDPKPAAHRAAVESAG